MTDRISQAAVAQALRRRLGPGMAQEAAGAVAVELNACITEDPDLAMTQERLENALLSALYRRLGAAMRFRREDGVTLRLGTEDLPEMADDVMALLFAAMLPTQRRFLEVQRYAMTSGSLSALRALVTVFAAYQSQEELRLVNHILLDRCGQSAAPERKP